MKRFLVLLALATPPAAQAQRYCNDIQAITIAQPKSLRYASSSTVVSFVNFDFANGSPMAFEVYENKTEAGRRIVLPIGMVLTVKADELIVNGSTKDTTLRVCPS